eukprot:134808-Amphidinium_carterae.1
MDYYREDQRKTFLHGWEGLTELRCRNDADLPHYWTTWQPLMLSMGKSAPEHFLLELLWSNVKDLRFLMSGYVSRGLTIDLMTDPDHSLKCLARCIERLAGTAGVVNDVDGADHAAEPSVLARSATADHVAHGDLMEHRALDVSDADMYAVPSFTGKLNPKCTARDGHFSPRPGPKHVDRSRPKSPSNSDTPSDKS